MVCLLDAHYHICNKIIGKKFLLEKRLNKKLFLKNSKAYRLVCTGNTFLHSSFYFFMITVRMDEQLR